MKIIDCHIHFSRAHGFEHTALEAGHVNSAEHLAAEFARLGVVKAIAMGSGGNDVPEYFPQAPNLAGDFAAAPYSQPGFVAYCAGLRSDELTPENTAVSLAEFEKLLKIRACVGIKMYPGYNHLYINDKRHRPFFELAEAYDVPVVVHTGDTAGNRGLVKYSHPLTLDEAAYDFQNVKFVMAHCGNPWIVDAVEVAAKNENVFIDISGLAAGQFDPDWFCSHYRGYLDHIRTWLQYLSRYDKILYGSDWPLVNLESYIEVVGRLIPEEHHEKVFYRNALNVFSKLRDT